jgi:hypothetical protein
MLEEIFHVAKVAVLTNIWNSNLWLPITQETYIFTRELRRNLKPNTGSSVSIYDTPHRKGRNRWTWVDSDQLLMYLSQIALEYTQYQDTGAKETLSDLANTVAAFTNAAKTAFSGLEPKDARKMQNLYQIAQEVFTPPGVLLPELQTLDEDVIRLVQHATKDVQALPILTDALIDCGLDHNVLQMHLRQPHREVDIKVCWSLHFLRKGITPIQVERQPL